MPPKDRYRLAASARLLARAQGAFLRAAPQGSDAAADLLDELDDALLLGWTAAERDRALPQGRAAAAALEKYAFYRRAMLRRLSRGGAKIGAGLLSSLFRGSAGRRMFLFVTHACQLRCAYCHVAKDGRKMSDATLEAGVRLMMRSLRPEVEFHFFGGEPMLAFGAVRKAVLLAERLAAERGKRVRFLLTTNGLELGEDALRFLEEHRFSVEFSCDGAHEAQLAQRRPAGGRDYYERLKENLARLRAAEVPYTVITVVLPGAAGGALEQFRYLAGLGHRRIQINYALGTLWDARARADFFRQMDAAAREARAAGIEFVNRTVSRREPVTLNGDLTLDCDGTLFRGPVLFDGALAREADGSSVGGGPEAAAAYARVRELFSAGRVDGAPLPEYHGATPFDNFVSLARAYRGHDRVRAVVLNNVEMGLSCREQGSL